MAEALAARARGGSRPRRGDDLFVRAALAPSGGRLNVVVLRALAARFGVPATTIARDAVPGAAAVAVPAVTRRRRLNGGVRARELRGERVGVGDGELAAAADADVGGRAPVDRDLVGDERGQPRERGDVGLGDAGERAVGDERAPQDGEQRRRRRRGAASRGETIAISRGSSVAQSSASSASVSASGLLGERRRRGRRTRGRRSRASDRRR